MNREDLRELLEEFSVRIRKLVREQLKAELARLGFATVPIEKLEAFPRKMLSCALLVLISGITI